MPRISRGFLMAVAAAGLVAGAAWACGDDGESNTNASQEAVDVMNARIQRNEQMFAVITLGTLGLHDMDESLEAGTIDPAFAGNTRTAVRLLALTDWDASVDAQAEEVRGHAVDLLTALSDEDIEAAAAAASALHETEHDFSEDVWAILAADLPADAGGVEAHDEGEETPAAGQTPDADAGDDTPASSETEAAGDEHEQGQPLGEATP